MKKIVKLLIAVCAATLSTVFLANAETQDIIDRETHPELYCLALNIYFEARGEQIEGQYAVADVTLNRVESSRFPDTICEVVYQCRRANRCQFSWVHQIRNPHNPRIREADAWQDAQLHAMEIMYWEIQRGITDGATYFHADWVRPRWRHDFEKTAQIGVHLFYRDPND
jgi:spore germination cell wall hydrolase CwlJ-like protein